MKVNLNNIPGIIILPIFICIIVPLFAIGLITFLLLGANKASVIMNLIDNILSKKI